MSKALLATPGDCLCHYTPRLKNGGLNKLHTDDFAILKALSVVKWTCEDGLRVTLGAGDGVTKSKRVLPFGTTTIFSKFHSVYYNMPYVVWIETEPQNQQGVQSSQLHLRVVWVNPMQWPKWKGFNLWQARMCSIFLIPSLKSLYNHMFCVPSSHVCPWPLSVIRWFI